MKIYPLSTLGKIFDTLKTDGKTIVQCHGCFDMLHIGHIRHFGQAKRYGDVLVVTVTSDQYVNKGSGRPIFPAADRTEMLDALECVDYIAISDYPNAVPSINIIRPDFLAKGIDYADKGTDPLERHAVINNGGMVVYTTTEKFSTTEIIAKCKSA